MLIGTPAVATHLLGNPENVLISMGAFLRKSSLDEFPKLRSILVGSCQDLFNQDEFHSSS